MCVKPPTNVEQRDAVYDLASRGRHMSAFPKSSWTSWVVCTQDKNGLISYHETFYVQFSIMRLGDQCEVTS